MTSAETSILSDDEIRHHLERHEAAIDRALAPYEPVSAFHAWLDTLRAIEDWINLATAKWPSVKMRRQVMSMPVAALLADLGRLHSVQALLKRRFSSNLSARIMKLALQSSAMCQAFAQHRIAELDHHFATIGTMQDYFQSRRRHFVAFLHKIPSACRGCNIVPPLDGLNIILPLVELHGASWVGAQQALNVDRARARLGLAPNGSWEIAMLDELWLEPERARIVDMPSTTEGQAILARREKLAPDRLFSAAELRNDILAIEAAFAEYGLPDTDFAPAAAFAHAISTQHVERDFWIRISPADIDALLDAAAAPPALRAALVNGDPSYNGCLSTYAPFIQSGPIYYSTVTLLSRFLYHWRARCLDRKRRYQIKTGFLFEKAVASAIELQGFDVQDITRIDHAEFDVIAVRDGIVWNLQCKNNFTDLAHVEADPDRFARYNARLVRSYERALAKENRREHLLEGRLANDNIEHVVIARFPVVTDNRRILPFSRIRRFAEFADALQRDTHC